MTFNFYSTLHWTLMDSSVLTCINLIHMARSALCNRSYSVRFSGDVGTISSRFFNGTILLFRADSEGRTKLIQGSID